MKGLLISITATAIMFITGCSPDPSREVLESYSFQMEAVSGNRYFPGETAEVRLKLINSIDTAVSSYTVIFTVEKGGGEIERETALTDRNGTVVTEWHLGNSSSLQVLKASLYRPSGTYITSTTLNVYVFNNDEWIEISAPPDGSMRCMAADTVNDVTVMVTTNTAYRQGRRYYLWEEIGGMDSDRPRTVEVDRNGVFYISTWSGNVLKSTDHGQTWITCTKPYPDHPYYIYMNVSNDNYLWVFKFDLPTKFSSDGGTTWQTAGSTIWECGYGDVFRLKDGSLLFHGSNTSSLYRSLDNGQTWTHISTPGLSTKLYVNEKDEIFICNQEGGLSILKSNDMGASFRKLYTVFPQFGTDMDNIFNKWKDVYYVLIPGYGILKSSDLNTYETYWANQDLNNLFIDHNGVLIAKDWDNKTVYYRKNTDD